MADKYDDLEVDSSDNSFEDSQLEIVEVYSWPPCLLPWMDFHKVRGLLLQTRKIPNMVSGKFEGSHTVSHTTSMCWIWHALPNLKRESTPRLTGAAESESNFMWFRVLTKFYLSNPILL